MRLNRPTASEQVANECLARCEQLVGKHVPGASLERASRECGAKRRRPFGAHGEIVVEQYPLPIEEKRRPSRRRVEQLIDQRDETLPKTGEWEIPFSIPVRVRDDVYVEWIESGHGIDKKKGRPNRPPLCCPWRQATGLRPVTRR